MTFKNLVTLVLFFTVSTLYAQRNKNYHTFLGVDINTMTAHTDGLYINGIYKGYGAEKAGLKPGDILQAVNAERVNSFDELVETLDRYKPGQQVELSILRNNSQQKISALLSDYPEFLKYATGYMDDEEARERTKPRLGINVESMWEQYALLVSGVSINSAAHQAGLQVGDVITKMDNYEFVSSEELNYYLSKYKAGDVVTLSVKRNGEQKLIKVKLTEEIKHNKDKNEWKEKKEKK